MKPPVMAEFPFETIKLEAKTREDYLGGLYFPEVKNQISNGTFSRMTELLYLKKVCSYGKGRSGAAAEDFIRRMKSRAKYTGRQFNGEIRPMCYFLDDLSITKLPPPNSTVLLISGSGEKPSVESKSRGCLKHGIDTIVFSYNPRCMITKCSTVYHHIPRKIENSSDEETLDAMGNSFESSNSSIAGV